MTDPYRDEHAAAVHRAQAAQEELARARAELEAWEEVRAMVVREPAPEKPAPSRWQRFKAWLARNWRALHQGAAASMPDGYQPRAPEGFDPDRVKPPPSGTGVVRPGLIEACTAPLQRPVERPQGGQAATALLAHRDASMELLASAARDVSSAANVRLDGANIRAGGDVNITVGGNRVVGRTACPDAAICPSDIDRLVVENDVVTVFGRKIPGGQLHMQLTDCRTPDELKALARAIGMPEEPDGTR